ncbi:hypothetical protein KC19_10G119100 [Ceratodon purpureus]|uniref:Uncharacterized protein n=1 Tax=Ceratodon purpureus TaxID=3225 RepID=A0A8T0GRN0_CERPU|nr:hypothetical protein KC19_10G119100 [Ceratodon purpureus]
MNIFIYVGLFVFTETCYSLSPASIVELSQKFQFEDVDVLTIRHIFSSTAMCLPYYT